MILKLFRAVWFLSVVVVLANLLYVYAMLPEEVVVRGGDSISVSKEVVFYLAVLVIAVINVFVYVLRSLLAGQENLRAWFHGLVITFNVFFVIALQALSVANSKDTFNHALAGPYLTGSLVLILMWAAAWPVYLLIQRFLVKQAV